MGRRKQAAMALTALYDEYGAPVVRKIVEALSVSPKAARDVAPILRDAVLYGAGSAENVRDIPRAMGEEAAFGLGMYGASRLAKKPAKAVARKVRSMFR